MENLSMNPAEDKENLSVAQQEEAVQENVEQPVEEAKEEAYQTPTNDDGDFVVNFDQPIQTEDAVQERETEEIPVGEQTGDSEGMEPEVREQPEQAASEPASDADFGIERIEEDAPAEEEKIVEEPVQEQVQTPEPVQPQPEVVLPENVQKVIDFMEETGGTLEDYVNLNKDVSKMNNTDLLREYYKQTKPHLDSDDISFQMDDKFRYDPDVDDERTIKAKQLAFKEELYKAQQHMQSQKDKYYADLKLNKQNSEIPEDYRHAYDFYNKQQEQAKATEKLAEQFKARTNEVFDNDFKGFDFKVGDSKFRVKVNNPQQTKEFQSNIDNFFNDFVDDNGGIKDVQKYHKALYTARNADKLAQHFYEQGRADAIKESAAKAKNIDMKPRQDAASIVTPSGNKFKVVSGDTSNGLKIKMRK